MTVITKGKTGWNVDVDAYLQEIINARGTAASLDARMDVAINEDGTLKTPTPGSGWWTQEADAVAYVSATSCTVGGDKTAIYLANRAFKADVTAGIVYSYVVSATYDSGTALTTVTIEDAVLDSGLSAVYYGQIPASSPAIVHDTTPQLGGDLDVNGHDFIGIVGMPNQSGCHVYRTTAQSIPNNTNTKMEFDAEEWDTQNEWDNVTNFRFTATKAGKYSVYASVLSAGVSWDAGEYWAIWLYKNGTLERVGTYNSFGATVTAHQFALLAAKASLVAGDYLEIIVAHSQGAAVDTMAAANAFCSVTKDE